MILASPLVWLSPGALLALALALFVGAEWLTPDPGQWGQAFSLPVSALFVPGGRGGWWVNYPVLQWLELVVLGLAGGRWLAEDPDVTLRRAWLPGAACLLAFVALRWLDGFGNIRPRAGDTWIDWLNVVKYPPSLTFSLLTTGFNLILLALFARISARGQRFFRPLVAFGQAPLFTYVLHLFLYAGIGYLLAPDGSTLASMLPFWLLGLLLLYPLSRWYGQFKQRQRVDSVWRFF